MAFFGNIPDLIWNVVSFLPCPAATPVATKGRWFDQECRCVLVLEHQCCYKSLRSLPFEIIVFIRKLTIKPEVGHVNIIFY